MSSTDASAETATRATGTGPAGFKLEVIVLPVADVDRAMQFYERLGWRLDAAFAAGDFRVVQLTPPGSPASIIFGAGVTDAVPGSVDGLVLAVDDVETARAELVDHGVDVSEVFHDAGGVFYHAGTRDRVPGPDPEGRSYASWASFADPDGNRWVLQEITSRLPGRVETTDVATLAELLRETAEQHDAFEKASAPHDWWDWYAPYLHAREQGDDGDAATAAADRYMEELRGVVRR